MVANHAGAEILPRKNSRHQAHRGAGIPAIDVAKGLGQTSRSALDDESSRFRRFDENTHLAHGLDGASAVLALKKIRDGARAVGERGQEDGAMGDAFIRRHGDFGFDACGAA